MSRLIPPPSLWHCLKTMRDFATNDLCRAIWRELSSQLIKKPTTSSHPHLISQCIKTGTRCLSTNCRLNNSGWPRSINAREKAQSSSINVHDWILIRTKREGERDSDCHWPLQHKEEWKQRGAEHLGSWHCIQMTAMPNKANKFVFPSALVMQGGAYAKWRKCSSSTHFQSWIAGVLRSTPASFCLQVLNTLFVMVNFP